MTELWDLYNSMKEPLNELHERGKPLPDGKYHIVVDILSVNSDGKILLTKRHPDKHHGGLWEFTGGSAVAGEKPLEAAVRELKEETGLSARPDELEYRGEIVRRGNSGGNAIHIFYLYRGDFSVKDITLQQGETVDLRLCTPREVRQMYESGELLDFVYHRMRAVFPNETNNEE